MSERTPRLLVQTSPFLRTGVSTPVLMLDVILAMVPILLAAIWFFGIGAFLVCLAAAAGAVFIEWLVKGSPRGRTLRDGTAVLTGMILGLTLPPGFPLWMAFLGGVVSIGLGKLIWGGLGNNLFNPALVGRAFLQAAFPTVITTWVPPSGIGQVLRSNFAIPLMQAPVDAMTAATPLNVMKFEHQTTDVASLVVGNIPGSLGETSAVLIILAGIVLAIRRTFDWRIPVSILVTVGVLSGAIWLIGGDRYPTPWFMLFSGGLLFGSVFMATDPVTSPLAPRGAVLFGFGIGLLVVLIRIWGGLPEGVMYAILLMNAAAPLLDRVNQPRAFGRTQKGGVRLKKGAAS